MERGINTRRIIGGAFPILIVAALLALFFGFRNYVPALHGPKLSVTARHLPYYAFCSFNRMLVAYVLALLFSICYGMLAARGRIWERVMIPAIDIAQSVPVVGFFPAAVYFFVALAHGSRLGVEMAAVFLIFTSQAWNLALGVFESIRTIPDDSREALEAFGANGWLRFRKLSLPACVPKLVYNSILSWVAGWYFLIACEIITAGPSTYRLPGLGSFLMEAANRGRNGEMVLGLLALLLIIIVMDLVVWQPLSVWAEKFRYEFTSGAEAERSLGMLHAIGLLGPSVYRAMRLVVRPLVVTVQALLEAAPPLGARTRERAARAARVVGYAALAAFAGLSGYALFRGLDALLRTLMTPWPAAVRQIPAATLASTIRMIVAYAISLAWTLPCALAAINSPRFKRWLSPIAEIVGSMPATALFPVIVVLVIQVTGEMNLASILLILTGMQWYLLFNLLAGASQIPEELKEFARAYRLSRWETWRKLDVPALVPSIVTGSITAWGGGWNALILSEYFVYRGHTYKVLGLGALLDAATYETGNNLMILLSLLSMVVVVVSLNRLVWRRLYNVATERYRFD
ncbi:MAG TPA: ABC transporter permease subunit [Candidatus Binataceae bacterium]|nr:ABC transporter permease subunit [Candidatus Binataceae bacterium]